MFSQAVTILLDTLDELVDQLDMLKLPQSLNFFRRIEWRIWRALTFMLLGLLGLVMCLVLALALIVKISFGLLELVVSFTQTLMGQQKQ